MLSSCISATKRAALLTTRLRAPVRTFSSTGIGGGSSSAAASGRGAALAVGSGCVAATLAYLYAMSSPTATANPSISVPPTLAGADASDVKNNNSLADDATISTSTTATAWIEEVKERMLEGSTSSCAAAPTAEASSTKTKSATVAAATSSGKTEEEIHLDTLTTIKDSNTGRLYKPVDVNLDPKIVEELPLMSIAEVMAADGLGGEGQKLLASYQGIVYDVTEFADHHPGGRDLLRTAAGLDLKHFFTNYTVHGMSDKAANWLAPLAVGKLSPEDALTIAQETTPEKHVEKRHIVLSRSRRKLLLVTFTLPIWMALRALIRMIGAIVPCFGRALASILPVTVPGYSRGAERLNPRAEEYESVQDKNGNWIRVKKEKKPYSVAVIGGGVAGCGAAWALNKSGFKVTLYESRPQISGNARTFDWDFSPFKESGKDIVKSCVSVTAWPPIYYKNYTAVLEELKIETVPMPLSWFLNSKVPGSEGTLWGADPRVYEGSLRKVFEKDFKAYAAAEKFARVTTDLFCLNWAPWKRNDSPSMYANHTGLGLLNPLNVVPLHTVFKAMGGSEKWWDVIFTPYYTASFLVDELRPFPAVFGPLIETQIPLLPNRSNTWQGSSKKSSNDCNITTCVTWKDAGKGIREVFRLLVEGVEVNDSKRVREVVVLPNGQKRVYDEYDGYVDVDRVVFACPANAIGNILKSHGNLEEIILNTPVYADDHHPSSGHMHAIMHSDASVIDKDYREDVLKRASNYVEVTQKADGTLNIENQYNFGVQTPGPGVFDLPVKDKPVMLISHALGEGKSIDKKLIRGTGNHARAHPLYSGWNVAAMLSLRLVQGKDGVYYCSNWTTPGNCHDMSILSGFCAAYAVGADYPFENNVEAKKDFNRLRDLMGI